MEGYLAAPTIEDVVAEIQNVIDDVECPRGLVDGEWIWVRKCLYKAVQLLSEK